jgi:hypothetical protein
MEYLAHRCCMCPQRNSASRICPGIPGKLHPDPSPCRFVKRYRDARGWIYFVSQVDTFKVFYRKSGESCAYIWRPVPWRESFDEAQADLNREAEKRSWEEV